MTALEEEASGLPSARGAELFGKNFTITAPNPSWVTDITYHTPSQRIPPV